MLLWLPACSGVTRAESSSSRSQEKVIAVDVKTASLEEPTQGTEYVGTTVPFREVVVQAQTQGQLLSLVPNLGDRIRKGQIIAEIDDKVLQDSVKQARAEREAQIAEVAGAQGRVAEVKTRVEQAKVDLAQAKSNVLQLENALSAQIESNRLQAEQTQKDANRLQNLYKSGVTSQQEAEQALTVAKQAQQTLLNSRANAKQQLDQARATVKNSEQLLKAAQAQVAVEQQTVEVANRQTTAQQALVDQAATQQAFSQIKAPISGIVMERQTEAGTFLQTGQSILTLGDFSRVKVIAQVSDQRLQDLQIGQTLTIRLDAFKDSQFLGKLTRISPLASSTSRLIPIEVLMENPNGTLGAGLLARISFEANSSPKVTVPETALQKTLSPPNSDSSDTRSKGNRQSFTAQNNAKTSFKPGDRAFVFVISNEKPTQVTARSVVLGNQRNNTFEIRQGLSPGERYVSRSSQPLQEGVTVQISALSQSSNEPS